MKRLMIFLAACFLVILSLTVSAQIPREDVLECGLPDGSRFVLRGSYTWHPLAKIIPHATERTNQRLFRVYLKLKGRSGQIPLDESLVYERSELNLKGGESFCNLFGSFRGVVYEAARGYKLPNEEQFQKIVYRKELMNSPEQGGNPPKHVVDALLRYEGKLWGGVFLLREDRLILERLVLNNKSEKGVAVYQLSSPDGGKTWTDPIVTTHAEAFELGKYFSEQCFIARPIRINGEKVDAHFPPCPANMGTGVPTE